MSQVLPKYKGRGNQEDTNSRERESPRTILEPALMTFLFLCKRDTGVSFTRDLGLQSTVLSVDKWLATCHVNVDEIQFPAFHGDGHESLREFCRGDSELCRKASSIHVDVHGSSGLSSHFLQETVQQ